MFLAALGVDFHCKAGILAHFYLHPAGFVMLIAGAVAGLPIQASTGTLKPS